MKPIYQSKTFWLNIIAIITLAGTYLLGYPQYATLGGEILACANIGLRIVTDEGISIGITEP